MVAVYQTTLSPMPTTATFKSKLYAHAQRAARPDRTVTDVTVASARLEPQDAGKDSPAIPSAGRTLSGLPDRGALLDPKAVTMIVFPGTKPRELSGKMKWVREHVPFKVPLGHKTVGWFEADVRWWLEDRRNGRFDSAPRRQRLRRSSEKRPAEQAAPVLRRRRVGREVQSRRAMKRRSSR